MSPAGYRTTAILICWTIAGLAIAVLTTDPLGIADRVPSDDRATINARADVTKEVAAPERDEKRFLKDLERLPEVQRGVLRIKQRLGIGVKYGG